MQLLEKCNISVMQQYHPPSLVQTLGHFKGVFFHFHLLERESTTNKIHEPTAISKFERAS